MNDQTWLDMALFRLASMENDYPNPPAPMCLKLQRQTVETLKLVILNKHFLLDNI